VDAFTKANPGVKITIEVTPGKEYFPKRQTEATTGTLPDVWWMNSSYLELYASEHKLLSLQDSVDSGAISTGNYPTALVDAATWKDELYGVPKDFDTIAVFYNKAVFDKAGVSYPTEDWTWDEFKSAARAISDKLKSEGVYGNVTDLSDGQGGYYDTIAQAGGYVLSPDKKTVGYDDPATVEGLQFWVDLIADGAEPTLQQIADTADDQRFVSGKAGMWWTGSWSAAQVAESPVASTTSVVKLPKGKVSATIMAGISNVVSADTKNKAAAVAFATYLGGKEAALVQARTGTVIPAFTGTQQDWIDAYPAEMNVGTFVDAATDGTAVPYPTSLNSNSWMNIERDMLPDAFDGHKSLTETVAKLTEQANAALAAQ
jgi:multiple sugar transport system substrate-binding protein